jgi:hypothetical protein
MELGLKDSLMVRLMWAIIKKIDPMVKDNIIGRTETITGVLF